MDSTLQLKLLGLPEIVANGVAVADQLPGKAQAILYYLAATGQPQARTVLATLLWGDMPESAARANLRKALAALRQTLDRYLQIERQSVAFKPGIKLRVDAVEFETGMSAAAPADIDRLQAAVDLYRGDFLAGFYVLNAPDFESWMYAEQARRREAMIQALHQLTSHFAGQGDFLRGIASVRRLLNLEPWREEAHRQLMVLLARNGQRSAALAQFDACRQVLSEELGVEPGRETVALYERIRDGEASKNAQERPAENSPAPPLSAPASARLAATYNLPAQSTAFIGRKNQLAAIVRRLTDRDCRLLTLVGAGGIGKTRLALQTAQTFIDNGVAGDFFPHGLFFVSLAGVSSTGGMVSAIAAAAEFSFYDSLPPRQQLLDFLQEKRLLLILDNLEHLLAPTDEETSSGTDLIADILTAAPAVKILVTSREALNLQEAWFHPVRGMPFPEAEPQPATGEQPDSNASGTALENYDAVRLFVQSASRARVDFSLAAEQRHVAQICRLVEGLPLAIELAAAWLKLLPAEKIAQEIQRNLDFLATRHQNIPARHRSIRAVFEQSWQLLNHPEQVALKQLAVFQGSFEQEAAEAVAGASLLTLAVLVEKSLLGVTESGRYQLHELLRQFAAEKLAADGADEASAHERHSAYYLRFLQARAQKLIGPEQRHVLAEVHRETDNLRLVWDWAVTKPNLDIIHGMSDSLYNFYQIRSRYQEGQEIFASAAAHLPQTRRLAGQPGFDLTLARVLARQGAFLYWLGDFDAARRQLAASLQATLPRRERAFVHLMFGKIARLQGRRSEAEESLGQALALNREAGDTGGMADALLGLAEVSGSFSDYTAGKSWATESLALYRKIQRPDRIAQALGALAWNMICLGAYGEAVTCYKESLAICREIGDQNGVALAVEFLGWVAWCEGRAFEAVAAYQQALVIYRQIGERSRLSMCLGDLALALIDLGNFSEAQKYAQEGLAITEQTGNLDLRVYNTYCLGAAVGGQGDFQAGRDYLRQSLTVARLAHLPDHMAAAVYYWAWLQVLADAAEALQWSEALKLLAAVKSHPATWHVFKERAAQLETTMLQNIGEPLNAYSQYKSLDKMVAELL